ncbi:hypothetical protein [Gallaecimonas mangrovi]|uniref:hypothetical protein n=1 Tax=Gallaecimonas mangrovi TaxID=2291597 RepID=UPI000E205133|nr:hypothetical protein [Gallaecimonas mangrovi]
MEKQRRDTLSSATNKQGKIISTSDERRVRVKPKHLLVERTLVPKPGLEVMQLRNKFSGDKFEVHSHNFGDFHQVPTNKARNRGDQQPLSPRTQQSLNAKWKHHQDE